MTTLMIELSDNFVSQFSVRWSVTMRASLHSIIFPLRLLAVFSTPRRTSSKAKRSILLFPLRKRICTIR